jgi:hypothetical protein
MAIAGPITIVKISCCGPSLLLSKEVRSSRRARCKEQPAQFVVLDAELSETHRPWPVRW